MTDVNKLYLHICGEQYMHRYPAVKTYGKLKNVCGEKLICNVFL